MEITEVRIKLMEDNSGSNERLQAFCSITFDDMFVIRDLKIIEGAKGFFVAMPSRKLTDRCVNVNHPIRRYERIDRMQISLVSGPYDQFLRSDDRDRRVAERVKVICSIGISARQIDHHIGVDQRNHRLARTNRADCP